MEKKKFVKVNATAGPFRVSATEGCIYLEKFRSFEKQSDFQKVLAKTKAMC